MNEEVRNLEPKRVWNNFADLNAVPRPSKREERVRAFMKEFGKSLNLEVLEDTTGNVVIKKPATKGMENRKTVVLQGHLDMVHQKNNDTDFDFETEGIKMYVDGDWVKAKGTTLGADNGLGVASIMTILESTDIPHPAIEALFTIDEEQGLTGAKGLGENMLEGEILLNLDTEEDTEIDVGCAGGIDVTASRNYKETDVQSGSKAYKLTVTGLEGGHSGMDIHKGLGNANKMMNRLLYAGYKAADMQVAAVNGGGLRNAIPRESVAVVVVSGNKADAFKNTFNDLAEAIKTEYVSLETNLKITWEETDLPSKAMELKDTGDFVKAVYAAHNGVFRMSPDISDLVETSNNVARVEAGKGKINIQCLTRSSVETGKYDLVNALTSAFESGGFEVTTSAEYPGWKPNMDSAILKVLVDIYEKQHSEKPDVVACHAGLECGVLLSHYPQLDAISFGPTIKGAHSPDERASISSLQKFWEYLLEILEHIPERA